MNWAAHRVAVKADTLQNQFFKHIHERMLSFRITLIALHVELPNHRALGNAILPSYCFRLDK